MPTNNSVNTRETTRTWSKQVFGPPYLYDPGSFGITFLFRWQGTILPMVLSSPLFWFLQFANGGFIYLYHNFEDVEPVLNWKAAIVPSSLLTFLLVSYSSQCFNRYFDLYDHCIQLHGCVMEWVA